MESTPVTFHLDRHLTILLDDETLEWVGLEIQDFERDFMPAHSAVRHVWEDVDNHFYNFGDLIIAVETHQSIVAREVGRAAKEKLPPEVAELIEGTLG